MLPGCSVLPSSSTGMPLPLAKDMGRWPDSISRLTFPGIKGDTNRLYRWKCHVVIYVLSSRHPGSDRRGAEQKALCLSRSCCTLEKKVEPVPSWDLVVDGCLSMAAERLAVASAGCWTSFHLANLGSNSVRRWWPVHQLENRRLHRVEGYLAPVKAQASTLSLWRKRQVLRDYLVPNGQIKRRRGFIFF